MMQRTTVRLAGWLARMLTRCLLAAATRPPARHEAVGYFQPGRTALDTQAARVLLPRAGYPAPHATHKSWGGGGYVRLGRHIVGGGGQGGGGTRRGRRFKTNSGFGMGSLLGGHVAYSSDRWRVYPFAGIGGMGQGFGVKPAWRMPKGAEQPALPSGGTGGMTLSAGWTVEYRLRLLPQAGLLLGVRVGWAALPLGIPWFMRGTGNARRVWPRFARPYVGLMLGGYVESGPEV